MENLNVKQILEWVVFGGGSIALLSWALDMIPAFGKMAADAKKTIVIVGSVVLSAGAYAVIVFVPVAQFVKWEPWLLAVLVPILQYSGVQVVHKLTKSKK